MNILISGGTGYIGSNLIKKLSNKGHNITCLYNNTDPFVFGENINWVKYDGTLDSLFTIKTKIDVIIHLATLFSQKNLIELIDKMILSNILFGVHLLEYAKKHNIKYFINTSSYAQSIDNISYSPQNFYASTKQAFEDILKFYTESNILKSITLSLFDVYGPDDARPKFINLLINALNKNDVFNMSKGDQNIRYVYIDDVIDAYYIAINLIQTNSFNKSATYSIYGNENLTLKQLVAYFCKVTGNNLKTNPGFYPYRDNEIMFCKPRYDKLPNWSPKINLEEGIKNILNKNKNKNKKTDERTIS